MSTKPIALINSNIPKLEKSLQPHFVVYIFNADELDCKLIQEIDPDILISRSTEKIDAQLLKNANISYYASATSGSDHVDLDYLNSKNIRSFIATGCNSNSVAEYILNAIYLKYGFTFNNKTIGIVGYGNIGSKVAKYCYNMGLNVLVNDPPKYDANFQFPEYTTHKNLNELINSSDILTVHVPFTTSGDYPTKHLLNSNLMEFAGELIIHTCRGGVANEQYLLEILKRAKVSSAIDVWENEPDINVDLLESSLVSTPHIAGHSANGKLNATKMIYDDLINFYNINTPKFNSNLPERSTLCSNNYEELILEIAKKRKIELDSNLFKQRITNSKDIQQDFKLFRKNYEMRSETIK